MYLIENGLRKVIPYYFEYKTPFKMRWKDLTISHVLCGELGQIRSVVEQGLRTGQIYITTNNGKSSCLERLEGEVAKGRLLQPHDIIYNIQHMHEPSVVWEKNLEIIFEDDQILIVNKPGGVPTHPGGIYKHNSLSEIVRNERKHEVWPCHRLDKSTLGLLVFAKTKQACKHYMALMKSKDLLEKWYVARVKGNFPHEFCSYTCPVFSVNSSGKGYINAAGLVPESTTVFRKSAYSQSKNESIVFCRPITGKMHQIRIHLRNLGHPIANDDFYGGQGLGKVKNGIEMEMYEKLFQAHPQYGQVALLNDVDNDRPSSCGASGIESEITHEKSGIVSMDADRASQPGNPCRSQSSPTQPTMLSADDGSCTSDPETSLSMEVATTPTTIDLQSLCLDSIRERIDKLGVLRTEADTQKISDECPECGRPSYNLQPKPGIWLHAFKLKCSDPHFEYTTAMPAWVREI